MTLNDLTTPSWWLTTVAGAIVLKIVSDYTRMGIEKLLSKGLSAWSSRSQRARERFALDVARLRISRELREIYFQRESRHRSLSIYTLLVSIFCISMVVVYDLTAGGPSLAALANVPALTFRAALSTKVAVLALFNFCFGVIAGAGFSASLANLFIAQIYSRTLTAATKGMFSDTSIVVGASDVTGK